MTISAFWHQPIDRERHKVERKTNAAGFPAVKSIDSFYFLAISSLNKVLVLGLARCDYINRNEKVIPVGNSGTGKTHVALALGLEARRKVRTVDSSPPQRSFTNCLWPETRNVC